MRRGPALLLSLWLSAAGPALGAEPFTFVSLTGVDNPTCARAAPCRTFAAAARATQPGGTLFVTGAGDFGPLVVGKNLTVDGGPGRATITMGSGTAIRIDSGRRDLNEQFLFRENPERLMTVTLRNLEISGGGAGTTGISIATAGAFSVENVGISGFATALEVRNPGPAVISVRDVTLTGNALGVKFLALDSGQMGFARMFVERSYFRNADNMAVVGSRATLQLSDSTVVGRTAGTILQDSRISVTGGGTLQSFGNNRIDGTAPALETTTLR